MRRIAFVAGLGLALCGTAQAELIKFEGLAPGPDVIIGPGSVYTPGPSVVTSYVEGSFTITSDSDTTGVETPFTLAEDAVAIDHSTPPDAASDIEGAFTAYADLGTGFGTQTQVLKVVATSGALFTLSSFDIEFEGSGVLTMTSSKDSTGTSILGALTPGLIVAGAGFSAADYTDVSFVTWTYTDTDTDFVSAVTTDIDDISVTISAVPEPTSLALASLALGATGLSAWRRRRVGAPSPAMAERGPAAVGAP